MAIKKVSPEVTARKDVVIFECADAGLEIALKRPTSVVWRGFKADVRSEIQAVKDSAYETAVAACVVEPSWEFLKDLADSSFPVIVDTLGEALFKCSGGTISSAQKKG